ncbi:MAG: Fe2+-dependent dioxygenase [Erythrobacter sp.]
MILSISIANNATLGALAPVLEKLTWRDGKETAGGQARKVKQNLQAVMQDDAGKAAQAALMPMIADNAVLKAAARPRRISPLLISKTQDGGHYGAHIDNALMGRGEARLRSDLSFTVFLSPKQDYEGGELVVHHAGVSQEISGEAGELVLYPSSSIHEVSPVTAGTRIVCVGWIESLIGDAAQRELLFDLENLRVNMRARGDTDPAELLALDKSIANLIRMWART